MYLLASTFFLVIQCFNNLTSTDLTGPLKPTKHNKREKGRVLKGIRPLVTPDDATGNCWEILLFNFQWPQMTFDLCQNNTALPLNMTNLYTSLKRAGLSYLEISQ